MKLSDIQKIKQSQEYTEDQNFEFKTLWVYSWNKLTVINVG